MSTCLVYEQLWARYCVRARSAGRRGCSRGHGYVCACVFCGDLRCSFALWIRALRVLITSAAMITPSLPSQRTVQNKASAAFAALHTKVVGEKAVSQLLSAIGLTNASRASVREEVARYGGKVNRAQFLRCVVIGVLHCSMFVRLDVRSASTLRAPTASPAISMPIHSASGCSST